jgi:hypothetical protein
VISLFGLAGILYAIVVVQERQRFFQGFLRLQEYATERQRTTGSVALTLCNVGRQ